MIRPDVSATEGSTSIGGNNSAPITNVNASDGAVIYINGEVDTRKLPSHLSAVVALFASERGFSAEARQSRDLPPEVEDKLKHNYMPRRHSIITDWTRHSLTLERVYKGVEQRNADARYLVRRRAGTVYEEELLKAAEKDDIPECDLGEFAREKSKELVKLVIDRLFHSYCVSKGELVEVEIAMLAVSLVVADAIIECEVLERPDNAAAP